eukprot:3763284-Rhodomonas_salina.2
MDTRKLSRTTESTVLDIGRSLHAEWKSGVPSEWTAPPRPSKTLSVPHSPSKTVPADLLTCAC